MLKQLTLILTGLTISLSALAQLPSQEQLNRQLTAVVRAFPGGFVRLRGAQLRAGAGTTDYRSTVQIPGAASTEVRHDQDEKGPYLNLHCLLAGPVTRAEADRLYAAWSNLLEHAVLNGKGLRLAERRQEGGDERSWYTWEQPDAVKAGIRAFRPRLSLAEDTHETYRLELAVFVAN